VSRPALTREHDTALAQAISLIPDTAPVSAQSAILPHLSQRRQVYEFPRLADANFVIVDSQLPISSQSLREGFHEVLDGLGSKGYREIFAAQSVRVLARP
jgi:hypothetical protein